MVKKIALVACALSLLSPGPGRGDALADLRAALSRLQSGENLRAKVEIETHHAGGETGNPLKSAGKSFVVVEEGADGLRMSWSPDQIRQSRAAAAARRAKPDAPRSDVATLTALEPDDALDLLDAAPPLLLALEGAALVEEKTDTYNGKSARLLLIHLDLRLPEEGRKALKESSAVLKLWLDPSGSPLASDRDIHLRLSKFFISYRVHDEQTRDYQLAGGRLMVTHEQHDNTGSGLGHSEETHTSMRVTLISPGS